MDQSMSFTPMGHQIATGLLLASPLVITAFWLGTMLRRKVSIREWFGLILLWAVSLPLLKLCFLTTPSAIQYPMTYYVPASMPYSSPPVVAPSAIPTTSGPSVPDTSASPEPRY